jgi:hypothetical protein
MKHIQHYEQNKETFDLIIRNKTGHQASHDLFIPFIEPFKKEFPTVNLENCQECVIDMLVWVKSEWKKTQEPTEKKKK